MTEEFRGGPGRPGVLFVCMGNICRSPTAEGVFRHRAERAGLLERLVVDSAGTHGYHEGHPPDRRAIAAARKRGYDLTPLRARQLVAADFQRFDYVLGMDAHNLREMQLLVPNGHAGFVGRLLQFAPQLGLLDVEDPYYGGDREFEAVLDQVEVAVDGLLAELRRRLDVRP
jgi:protein-tyrosine phosphatase